MNKQLAVCCNNNEHQIWRYKTCIDIYNCNKKRTGNTDSFINIVICEEFSMRNA